MTRTELIIQLLKILIGLAFGAYFVWWSLEVLDRLTPEDEVRAAVTNARLDPIQEAAIQRTLFCGFDIRKKARVHHVARRLVLPARRCIYD
jgi:hypothetical protein